MELTRSGQINYGKCAVHHFLIGTAVRIYRPSFVCLTVVEMIQQLPVSLGEKLAAVVCAFRAVEVLPPAAATHLLGGDLVRVERRPPKKVTITVLLSNTTCIRNHP